MQQNNEKMDVITKAKVLFQVKRQNPSSSPWDMFQVLCNTYTKHNKV